MLSSAPVTAAASLTVDQQAALDRVRRFARLMDTAFEIPGTGFSVGLDTLVGLIPAYGDAATALANCYVPFEAYRLGAPPALIARMLLNIVIDAVVGTIPVLGDLFDAAFKANVRNVAMLERFLADA